MDKSRLLEMKNEFSAELANVLAYWTERCRQPDGGYLTVNRAGEVQSREGLNRSAVLSGRVLWVLSAAYNLTGDEKALAAAREQYAYLRDRFVDPEYGWIFSSVTPDGAPADDRKDTYNGTFTLFAFAEYYAASGDPEALEKAKELYRTIEARARDHEKGGYIDTFARDWSPLPVTKSLRAQLHVLECYSRLYTVWPDEGLRGHIAALVDNLCTKALDRDTGALKQWFSADWVPTDDEDSYGDDIEGAWIFRACAEAAGVPTDGVAALEATLMRHVLREGYDYGRGGVWSKWHLGAKVTDKSWWMQCEAINAFFAWYERTGEEKYLDFADKTWRFTRNAFCDGTGAWCMNVTEFGEDTNPAKIANCPYHNARVAIMSIAAIDRLLTK